VSRSVYDLLFLSRGHGSSLLLLTVISELLFA
jgi:hypothetical protein